MVTCDSLSQCGKNSGLKVHRTKTRAVLIDAMHRSSSSSVLESAQWTSATLRITGRVSAMPRICRQQRSDREIPLPLGRQIWR